MLQTGVCCVRVSHETVTENIFLTVMFYSVYCYQEHHCFFNRTIVFHKKVTLVYVSDCLAWISYFLMQ